MNSNGLKAVIVGGGIAGLSTAVYALKCGYNVELLEMNDMVGGLATSWRRGPYTFETCLHWLLGSKPGAEFNNYWEELFDFSKLRVINPDVFLQIERQSGDALTIYTNVDKLETELLRRAPWDTKAIHDLTHMIRVLGRFKMLDPASGLSTNWLKMLQDAPMFPLMSKLMRTTGSDFGKRFADPLLQSFFAGGLGKLSAIASVLSLAWMNSGNAGYPIGGSQAIIRLIEERIAELGGKISYQSKVRRILVENDIATGVELESGRVILADWVISGADGHSTLFDLLGGRYIAPALQKKYDEGEAFPSYVQISLGIAKNLKAEPPMVSILLDEPLSVDPGTELDHIAVRFFHYDPTFAPPGKTAVTCFLPTYNYAFWEELRNNNAAAYCAEKYRVRDAVLAVLERRMPGISAAVEVTDVATPATVMRYTGNWRGSMEGWLIVPDSGIKPLPNTLPGLKNFFMVGQWISPGGGLPCGPMTARPVVKAMCRHDHVAFEVGAREGTPASQVPGHDQAARVNH